MTTTRASLDELTLSAKVSARAAAYSGPEQFPYAVDLHSELRRVADWIVKEQNPDGLWRQPNQTHMFYADAYAIRALLAAASILNCPAYATSACRWIDYILDHQRHDGGWWTGYGGETQTTVYVADDGEIAMALVCAYHVFKRQPSMNDRARRLKEALLRFDGFIAQFRLTSGAIGLGYCLGDLYSGLTQPALNPVMQGHYRPYPFATVVSGVNVCAALYAITGNPQDWDHAMQALDWCVENSFIDTKTSMKHELKAQVDLRLLHRCLDVAFMCSSEPFEMTAKDAVTPEPYFRSAARQKLYALWRYVLLLVAESQLGTGEWFGPYDDLEYMVYRYSLRHRLYWLYALTIYIQSQDLHGNANAVLTQARNRQFWLCADTFILRDHYGVCQNNPLMPSGLWGLVLAELIQPRITLPCCVAR